MKSGTYELGKGKTPWPNEGGGGGSGSSSSINYKFVRQRARKYLWTKSRYNITLFLFFRIARVTLTVLAAWWQHRHLPEKRSVAEDGAATPTTYLSIPSLVFTVFDGSQTRNTFLSSFLPSSVCVRRDFFNVTPTNYSRLLSIGEDI